MQSVAVVEPRFKRSLKDLTQLQRIVVIVLLVLETSFGVLTVLVSIYLRVIEEGTCKLVLVFN